jgi:hypothetical protein
VTGYWRPASGLYTESLMKKLLRFLLLAAVVAAVVWATRERMLPKPPPPDHHPPPFRKPSQPGTEPTVATASDDRKPAPGTPDELQRVKGIGPVYEGKLLDLGIRTFSQLVGSDSDHIAAELDVQVVTVVDWKTQATEFLG